MSRLIIHIGTHKTATTTVQRQLAQNRTSLATRGIWYPDYDLIDKGGHYAHLGIVNGFSGQHDKFSVQDAQVFFARVSERARDFDATILSGEPFYRHIAYDKSGRIPYRPEAYWPLREAYITQVREAFATIPVEIIVVFRRQVDYAPSLYQEQVKVTRYASTFADFRREYWYHFDYLRQARAWAATFDRLVVMRFEELIGGGDPTGALGARLGLDLSNLKAVRAQNVSMPPDAVVLKRLLHATKINKDVLRTDIETALAGPLRRRVRKFNNRSLYDHAKDMRSFHESFAAENETLRLEFLPETPEPIFSNRLRSDLRFGDKLHPYFLNMLVKGLIGQ